eukprot:1139827-Rhodomonas_salina.1
MASTTETAGQAGASSTTESTVGEEESRRMASTAEQTGGQAKEGSAGAAGERETAARRPTVAPKRFVEEQSGFKKSKVAKVEKKHTPKKKVVADGFESWFAILVDADWRDQRGFRLFEICSDARPHGECKTREWFSTAGMGDCAPGNQKFVPKTMGTKKMQLKHETWLPVSVSSGKHRSASYKQIVSETDMVTEAYKVLDGK